MAAISNQKLAYVVNVYEHFMKYHKHSKRHPMGEIKKQGKGWFLSTHLDNDVPAAPNRRFARMAKFGVSVGSNGKMTKARRKRGSLIKRKLNLV